MPHKSVEAIGRYVCRDTAQACRGRAHGVPISIVALRAWDVALCVWTEATGCLWLIKGQTDETVRGLRCNSSVALPRSKYYTN